MKPILEYLYNRKGAIRHTENFADYVKKGHWHLKDIKKFFYSKPENKKQFTIDKTEKIGDTFIVRFYSNQKSSIVDFLIYLWNTWSDAELEMNNNILFSAFNSENNKHLTQIISQQQEIIQCMSKVQNFLPRQGIPEVELTLDLYDNSVLSIKITTK